MLPTPAPPRGYVPDAGRAAGSQPVRSRSDSNQSVATPSTQEDQRNATGDAPGVANNDTQVTNSDKGSANAGGPGVKVSKNVANGETQSMVVTEPDPSANSSLKRRHVGGGGGKQDGSGGSGGGKLVEGEDEEYPDAEKKEDEDTPVSKRKKWGRRLGKLAACIGCKVACTAAICACIQTYPCHAPCCCGL